eukprot:jgi/Psemu1/63550/estExt_Genemark1.C_290126
MTSLATLRAGEPISPSSPDLNRGRNACHLHEGNSHSRIDIRIRLATDIDEISNTPCSRRIKAKNTSDNDDSTKQKNGTAVAPATIISCSSDIKDRSDTLDEEYDELNPIRLDESREGDPSQLLRMACAFSIRDISVDHGNNNERHPENLVGIHTKKSCDGAVVRNEQDWTKNIAFVASSSGNLTEDMEGDDSSASSITTIIGSEHSSVADAVDLGDDIDSIFNPEDNTDGRKSKNEYDNNDLSDCDPLQSKTFDFFWNSDDSNIATGKNLSRDIPSKGPKTSKINPMTGQRSLTDDMQEWRRNGSSSFRSRARVRKPSNRLDKKKYEENAYMPTETIHSYPLRRGSSNKAQELSATTLFDSSVKNPAVKKCRLLRDIAPYNRPGLKCTFGCGSLPLEAETRVETKNARVLRATQTKIVSKYNDGKRATRLINPAKLKKKNSAAKIKIGELKKLAAHNAPGFKTMDDNFLGWVPLSELKNDGGVVTSHATFTSNSKANQIKRLKQNRSHTVLSAVKQKKVKSIRVIVGGKVFSPPNESTDRLIIEPLWEVTTGSSTTKLSFPKKNIERKPGCQISTQNLTKNLMQKGGAKQRRRQWNVDVIENLSVRIAKKFFFNPSGRKGREWLKIYFGTVVNKQVLTASDGTCKTLWRVVYDDEDEEDFDETEFYRASNLYNDSKELDDKLDVESSMQTDDNRGDPKRRDDNEKQNNPTTTLDSKQVSQSSHEKKKSLLQNDKQSKTQNGSLLLQDRMHAEIVTPTISESVKKRVRKKIDRRRSAKRERYTSKKQKHSYKQGKDPPLSQRGQKHNHYGLSCELVRYLDT